MADIPLEKALVDRVRNGDRAAFENLVENCRDQVERVVFKMIGHPDDSADIMQDSLLKAWRSIGSFRGDARFATWLTAIATKTAIDFLRSQKRWRSEAQVAYANLCATSPELSQEVIGAFSAPDFSYEVREHISYCFSCVGRSLPPDELAALVLRDVVDLSARDAAAALNVSDSVFRHRLAAARLSMQSQYEGLCALVSKTGICHQCKGLRMIASEDRKGGQFPDVRDFAERCAIVQNCKTTSMQHLHSIFWRRTKEIEETGLGSTKPDSKCGVNDGES